MCKFKKVIKDIINCPNVKAIYNDESNACSVIVNYQREKEVELDDFKGPEAWNGRLNKSKILVISSNPGIGDDEVIPTITWSTKESIDFYQNRFSIKRKWVEDLCGIQKDGNYSDKKVSNWVQTKNRMEYLFGKNVKFGTDYTLLELVHCKSTEEIGVTEAIQECTNRYFDKTMNISPARILLITGDIAINFICKRYGIQKRTVNKGYGLYNSISIGGRDRLIIFLPHTNYRGERKAEYFIDDNDKQQINIFLKNNNLTLYKTFFRYFHPNPGTKLAPKKKLQFLRL